MIRKLFFLLLLLVLLPVSSVSAYDVVPVNGDFSSSLTGWTLNQSNYSHYCGFEGSSGHDANGSAGAFYFCDYLSDVFTPTSSSVVTFWAKVDSCSGFGCGDPYHINYGVDCGSPSVDYSDEEILLDGDWHEFMFDISSVHDNSCNFYFGSSDEGYYLLDDVSVSNAYNGPSEDVTITPNPTSTSYPTAVPTATPIGGVVGGGGAGLCPSEDPCYVIVSNTPLPVDILGVGGTPISAGGGIPIQGGNSTPVVVAFPTVSVTAVSAASVSVSGSSAVFRSAAVSGVMPVGGVTGAGVSDIVGVDIDKNEVTGCLPGDVGSVLNTDGNDCVSVPVYSVNSYKMLGVDLLAGFAVVSVGLFIVFVIRQLQEK